MHARSSASVRESIYVTPHAVERFGLHHGSASWKTLLRAWHAGIDIDPQTAQFLAGRDRPRKGSRYRLTADRRGLIVLEPGAWGRGARWVAVTYLRFGPSQEAFAWEHWPA